MKILITLVLVAGTVGRALLGGTPMQQMASATYMPRQLSQISR